ncbi:MAG TPA: transaldolase [Anaerolineae bacterium]|jgi:transaldolase/glucose-6-phosphate isomerase|nr:transaldolase [Anaerolineae bacterium]
MAKTRAYELKRYGQSLWLDFIERGLITSGELKQMVEDDGLSGLTSNPTIFKEALSGGTEYDQSCRVLFQQGRSNPEIYDILTREDIQMAADVLHPVYDATGGDDGYACIEVLASYAYDVEMTIREVNRVATQTARDNVLVKVPGTPEGVHAFRDLIASGKKINVTLLFSPEQYERIANAYIEGLEELDKKGGDLRQVASVASLFLSRIDTKVDKQIDKMRETASETERSELDTLRGTAATSTAKVTYQKFKEIFGAERFQRLKEKGARVQRPLWASMSTKDPAYSDVKYVEALIGPDTVVTVPKKTLAAMRDHLVVRPTLEEGAEEAQSNLKRIKEVGIDLEGSYEDLQKEGVELFDTSYNELLSALDEKRVQLLAA